MSNVSLSDKTTGRLWRQTHLFCFGLISLEPLKLSKKFELLMYYTFPEHKYMSSKVDECVYLVLVTVY